MNTQNNNKKQDSTVSPMTAAITGAVVGAGIAAAGAMALKDDNTREKAKEFINSAKDKASDYMENVQNAVKGEAAEIEKKSADSKSEANTSAKNSKS